MNDAVSMDESSLATLVYRWGKASSEVLLEQPHSQTFRAPGIEGMIGYSVQSNFAITFGDPICPSEQAAQLATAFKKFCDDKKLSIIYIIISEKFASWAIQNQCKVMIEAAEELVFDPQLNLVEGSKSKKLRNYIHHAINIGLQFHEYLVFDEQIERSIDQLGKAWLKGRRGPQIHLGSLDFFKDRTSKRWFYVKQNDQILGMVLLSRRESEKGWLLKFLLSHPEAPRGTSEFMMVSILEALRNENCHYLTYGAVAASHLGQIVGLSVFSNWLAKIGFTLTKWIFRLDRQKIFWKKFQPKVERSFILFSKPSVGVQELRAILNSLKIN